MTLSLGRYPLQNSEEKMRERPQTRSASLWLLQWRQGGALSVRCHTPHLRTCAAPCGGRSAACGALRNTIANIKREKRQGQRHEEAPQLRGWLCTVRKNLTTCSETLKKRVKKLQHQLK